MKRPVLAMLLAAMTAASTAPARADDGDKKEEARGRFSRGVELYRDGDYRSALIEFNRAYQIVPNFRVLYNIGQTCLELQDYACALRAFEKYVSEGKSEAPADRKASAESEVKRLQKLVGYLRVTVDQPGAEVLIDNVSVGRTPLADPILVGAGRRTVTVVLPPNPPTTRAVDIAGGDRVDVNMQIGEGPKRETTTTTTTTPITPPRREAPPESRSNARSNAPVWIGVGVTGALTAGTVVFGLMTLGAKKDFDNAKNSYPGDSQAIDDARSKVNRDAIITDVLGGAALLGAAVTAYLALTSSGSSRTGSDAPSVRVGLAPGGATLSGRF